MAEAFAGNRQVNCPQLIDSVYGFLQMAPIPFRHYQLGCLAGGNLDGHGFDDCGAVHFHGYSSSPLQVANFSRLAAQ